MAPFLRCPVGHPCEGGTMNNPWKMTAIGMALVVVTALVTTVVVANWKGSSADPPAIGSASPRSDTTPAPPGASLAPAASSTAPAATAPAPAPAVPTKAAIQACNRQAETTKDKTVEVVKDGAIGGAIGAAVGAAGGAIAGGGGGAGKGAAIGGLVGAGGGVLYGLNENKQH